MNTALIKMILLEKQIAQKEQERSKAIAYTSPPINNELGKITDLIYKIITK